MLLRGGIELRRKRGISVRVVAGWDRVRVPVVVEVAAWPARRTPLIDPIFTGRVTIV